MHEARCSILGADRCRLFECIEDSSRASRGVDWAARGEVSHLDLEADLNEPLPLPEGGFDTVLATDVFEHVSHPRRMFREISRLLRPEGTLIAGVPFCTGFMRSRMTTTGTRSFALRHLCTESGLKVSSVEPYGGAPEILFDTLSEDTELRSARRDGGGPVDGGGDHGAGPGLWGERGGTPCVPGNGAEASHWATA